MTLATSALPPELYGHRVTAMYMYMALLCTTSAVSIVTIEVALVTLKSKLEVKVSATKLASCVTCKDLRPAICVAHA